ALQLQPVGAQERAQRDVEARRDGEQGIPWAHDVVLGGRGRAGWEREGGTDERGTQDGDPDPSHASPSAHRPAVASNRAKQRPDQGRRTAGGKGIQAGAYRERSPAGPPPTTPTTPSATSLRRWASTERAAALCSPASTP